MCGLFRGTLLGLTLTKDPRVDETRGFLQPGTGARIALIGEGISFSDVISGTADGLTCPAYAQ
jgi:hypothetical protein